jgi:hypothetical protein
VKSAAMYKSERGTGRAMPVVVSRTKSVQSPPRCSDLV